MTSLPQVREHITAADFQTVAAFLPPAGDGRTLAVSANEKAVILRGKRVVDMFSGGSKPLRTNDEAIIASLRKYQLIIGFGDCSHSGYNLSPTRIHASRPAFRIAGGEEIRSMIAAISFALDKDDRANVEKLMAVNAAGADAITVADLAASLPDLPQFIQTIIAVQSFDGPSIRTADPDRIAGIERQILLAADGMLREYGALSDGAILNVIATSRDAELTMPEKDREANAEHLLTLANLHREDGRLERQIQAMEKRLETERIARQTEMMRTEIMEERLKQSRIQSEIERIDPRIGETTTNVKPLSPPRTTSAPPAQSVGNSLPVSRESRYWLNETASGVTLHKGTCAHVRNWAKPPKWRSFSTREIALNSARRPVVGCGRCRPYLGDNANIPAITREALAEMNRKDSDGRTRLHRAAYTGNADLTKKLIANGANLDAHDKKGKTPLHLATERDNIEAARVLIDAGANFDAKDKAGDTPLHEVAYRGGTEAAQTLIDAGANVNAESEHGSTPLHKAADMGRAEVAQALIDAGANVNAKSDHGSTPLHWASRTDGRNEAARVLISAGADINVKNNQGSTPLHICEDEETARALIDAGADIHAKDKDGSTPLHEASSSEQSTLRKLANATRGGGISIKMTFDDPMALLNRESSSKLAIARMLIDAGANLNAKDEDGKTPLHKASSIGFATTQALIAAGADIHAKDEDGRTPLHQAVEKGIARVLIAAGADIHTKDNVGRTPLHQAVSGHAIGTAQALIYAGADVYATDNAGDTPISIASSNRSCDLISHAQNDASAKYKKLHTAALRGDTKTVQALIDVGLNIDAKDSDGSTPLHRAVDLGRAETSQVLIVAGANLNAKDAGGDTPLHRAAHKGETEAVQALITAGANLDAVNASGDTPLHRAAHSGKTETARALTAAGADLDARDADGRTPLRRATDRGKRKTAQALIAAGADSDGETPLDMADIQGNSETVQPSADPGGKPAKTSWLAKLFGR